MQNRRVYPFNEGRVVTWMAATGQFVAHREEAEYPRGHSHSVLSAIADLNRKLDDYCEPEEFDHQAARWDHARDLRKHEVV